MKSFLILVLTVALLAAAYFTRPGKDDFKRFIVAQQTKSDAGFFRKMVSEAVAESFAERCTFNDHYLWVDVQRDGKTVFTGAFAHWFSHDAVKKEIEKVEDKVHQGETLLEKT